MKLFDHQEHTAQFLLDTPRAWVQSDPGCVDAGTEFLTPRGWKRIDQYTEGDLVAQYNPKTGAAEFVVPDAYVKKPCEEMIHFHTQRGVDQMLSPEHRMLLFRRDGVSWEVLSASTVAELHSVRQQGYRRYFKTTFALMSGTPFLTDEQLRLQVAVMADGHLSSSGKCSVNIKRQDKRDRLRQLLKAAGVEFAIHLSGEGYERFYFSPPLQTKTPTDVLWDLPDSQRRIVVDECAYWDGSRRKAGAVDFCSRDKCTADWVQFCAVTSGRTATLLSYNRDDATDYVVHIRKAESRIGLAGGSSKATVKRVPAPDGYKYCFTIPTSFFVARRNGRVFTTGNTGKTISTLEAYRRWRRAGNTGKLLVLAPLSILQPAWGGDIAKWLGGEFSYVCAYAKNREVAFRSDVDIILTNHDAVKWLIKRPELLSEAFPQGEAEHWLVIDECFVAGTEIETAEGTKAIEDITLQDEVLTEAGPKRVLAVGSRKVAVDSLVTLELSDGRKITCTEEHPLFTRHGWVCAAECEGLNVLGPVDLSGMQRDLRDSTHGVPCSSAQGRDALLLEILRTEEMAWRQSRALAGDCKRDGGRQPGVPLVEQREALGTGAPCANVRAGTGDGPSPAYPRRERTGDVTYRIPSEDRSPGEFQMELPRSVGREAARLSYQLQGRLRGSGAEDRCRSGWELSPHGPGQAARCEENGETRGTRVVRVSHHDGRGEADVWNLTIADAPRFFANGVLAHNCTAYKNPTSQRSKAMLTLRTWFKRRIAMSGTPTAKDVLDIFHPTLIVDDGVHLGNKFFSFRNQVASPVQVGPDPKMVKWVPHDTAEEFVAQALTDICIRYRFEDCIDIPPNQTITYNVDLPAKLRKLYDQMLDTSVIENDDGNVVTAVNAGVRVRKLLQLLTGTVYDQAGEPTHFHTERYELVMQLVQERQQSVVAFNWKHEVEALTKLADKLRISYGVIDGSIKHEERTRVVDRFQEGELQVIFAHPQSAGHGLTLTAGTATIWCSPTYNAEHYQQFNRRIYRAGQTQATQTIHIAARDTAEEDVYEQLSGKLTRMEDLLALFATATTA